MAYINQVNVGGTVYGITGVDTAIEVAYGNQQKTTLRNALFGTDSTAITTVIRGGGLFKYITDSIAESVNTQSVTTSSLTVRTSAQANTLQYNKINNSPINIEWNTATEVGTVTFKMPAQAPSDYAISWTDYEDTQGALAFTIPDQLVLTKGSLNIPLIFTSSNVDDDDETEMGIAPARNNYCFLGTTYNRFYSICSTNIDTDTAIFKQVKNSPINIFENAEGHVVTQFAVPNTNSDKTAYAITWGQYNNALQMLVPSNFSMCAQAPGQDNAQSDSYVTSIGTQDMPWGVGYFDSLFINKNINMVGGVAFASGDSWDTTMGIRLSSMSNSALTFKDYGGNNVFGTLSFDYRTRAGSSSWVMQCSQPLEIDGDITIKDRIVFDLGNEQTIRISYQNNKLQAWLYTGGSPVQQVFWA